MSDWGFETGAFAEADSATQHPLRTARELIVEGHPRRALDLLSEHHELLADDPQYLIACSEAWWADGDALRAQQALLGAARQLPRDPTPLLLLAELLRQGGEPEKAERVLAKAEALGGSQRPSRVEGLAPSQPLPEDLIAAAELQERRTHVWVTPKRLLSAGAVLIGVSALVFAIGRVTDPETKSTIPKPGIAAAAAESGSASRPAQQGPTAELEPAGSVSAEARPVVESTTYHGIAQKSAREASRESATTTEVSKTTPKRTSRSNTSKSRRKRLAKKPAGRVTPEPPPLLALTSSDPKALTTQGDALHATGQTGLAATYFRRALEVDPDYAPALVSVGRSILRAESYEEAFVNATRALQLARGVDSRPGLEAEAIYQLGRVHLHRGNLDAARRLFRQSTTLPAAPSEAWFYLGETLASGNSSAARNAYEAYLLRVSNGHLAERARKAIQ